MSLPWMSPKQLFLKSLSTLVVSATLLVACGLVGADETPPALGRQIVSFDLEWRFHAGEVPGSDHGVTGATTSPPEASGAALAHYDDSNWLRVVVPHDFVVTGTYDPKADTGHGFLPSGIGWYRKRFALTAKDRGKRLFLDFDGVYRNSTVWINGHRLGTHASGYTGFRYDITDWVNFDMPNIIAVRADSTHAEGWWYEGGGIYRHVWLVKTDPVHVAHWGTFVTAQVKGAGTDGVAPADVTAHITVENAAAGETACELNSKIMDAAGKPVAEVTTPASIGAGASVDVVQQIQLASARLWSLESPTLYRLVTTVRRAGNVIDTYETPFGVRTFRFDPQTGFTLNGKPVKIKGTCNHQDFAGVGVGLPDRLHVYKIEKLKEMGSNAYRCAHNPPANELLDACDQLGMLVMDENRHLGDTYDAKTATGTPFTNLSDLTDMIRRDRNHPSIIMWSLCNEEGLQGSEEGARIFAAMKHAVLALDMTRPVTCAMNGGWGQGISNVEDLQGCNYNPGGYDVFHRAHPQASMYGSETASTVSTRGQYANDPQRGYVSAYDVNAPPWAQTAEVAWRALAERPFIAGGFVWTGFDYRGEPTPYAWPCINSHFGIMDVCGLPKDNYYYYKAWWDAKPLVHLLPHWNWPGKEGREIDVWCHSNCDRVELFLNGKSLGAQVMPAYGHLNWKVKYAPGHLEARGYRADKLVATDYVETTGPPQRLHLMPDRIALNADDKDVAVVTVAVRDERGRIVPTASDLIKFHISGDARIIGVGNGDPSSHEPDSAQQRHAFNGYCLVLIQTGHHTSYVTLTAEATGLQSSQVVLRSVTYENN
jgi:beta-galactosidase